MDHSLYVAAISEIVCKNLHLKEIEIDPLLARTIGIGHDLGHAPFGHAGEQVLNQLAGQIGGFKHERHGLRIVDKLEKPKNEIPVIGLNLTLAVRDGIVNHCGEDKATRISPITEPNLAEDSLPSTLEGCVVRIADKVAYLGRDIEDAIVAGLVNEENIPARIKTHIGTRNGEIVDFFVGDLIKASGETEIGLSDEAGALMKQLSDFNYDRIYRHPKVEVYKERVNDVLEVLFTRLTRILSTNEDKIDQYMNNGLNVYALLGRFLDERRQLYFKEEAGSYDSDEKLFMRIAVDFMSTLTDRLVFESCSEFFLPEPIV